MHTRRTLFVCASATALSLALGSPALAQFGSSVDLDPQFPPTATWPVFQDVSDALGKGGAELADIGTGRGQVWADLVGAGPGGELTGPDGIPDWYQVNSNSPALPSNVPPSQALVPANGSVIRPSPLFRGLPDGTYDEVSALAGAPQPNGFGVDRPGGSPWGVSTADFDGDGLLDLFVPCGGFIMNSPNALLRARGDGTFENVGQSAGLIQNQASRTSLWLDFDRDGDLDLHVTNGHPLETEAFFLGDPDTSAVDRLYVNQGDGTFVENGAAAGVALNGTSFAATSGDLDQDGLADLVVACFKQFNKVFYSRGDGTFSFMFPDGGPMQVGLDSLTPDPQFPGTVDFGGSGPMASFMDQLPVLGLTTLPVEAADFNGDGWLDLIYGSWSNQLEDGNLSGAEGATFAPFERAHVYLNRGDQDGDGRGDGLFREVAEEVGIGLVGGVMGLRVDDYNGDGFPDVYMAAGGPKPGVHLEEDYTFINEPTAWPADFQADPDQALERVFYEVGAWTGTYQNVFMAHGVNSRVGSEGRLDLVISNGGPGQSDLGQANAYLRNVANADGSGPLPIQIELSDPGAPLPHGAGARVELLRDHGGGPGQVLVRQLDTNRGFSSQTTEPVPFYAGGDDQLFVQVRWPDGWQQGLLTWPIATQLHQLELQRSPVSMTFDRTPLAGGDQRLSAAIQIDAGALGADLAVGTLWLARVAGVDPAQPSQSPFTVVGLTPIELPLIVTPDQPYAVSVDVPEIEPGMYVLRYVGLLGETLAEAAIWCDGPAPLASILVGAQVESLPASARLRRSIVARQELRVRTDRARLVRNVARPTPDQTLELDLTRPGSHRLAGDARLDWEPGELRVTVGPRAAQWQFQGDSARLYLDVPLSCCEHTVVNPADGESIVPEGPGWRLELDFNAPSETTPWELEIDGTPYTRSGARP